MQPNDNVPAAPNEAWGFIGTMREHAPTAWPIAMRGIAKATGEPMESVRAFLDSRSGRHFADDVLNEVHAGEPLPQAIQKAIDRWMAWRIGAKTSAYHGIPRGLPYLTGFVIDAAMQEELA
ncbi:hypothetical protein [Eleftheria terrae]|uniref:hypothetical protein n=1 Tax=Eleftheria terrae TaxID=1597781 RepID=UPI00263B170F|nr:hypothetical protein [Eleftheria terrae]WKB50793.1 hypothetical protein N7L95_13305 [Eleftheria terrae]